VHFEWLHGNWSRVLRGIEGPRSPTHLKIGFDEFEYGFTYRRVLEGQSEQNDLWTVGRNCLWPNCLFTGGHFEWRVPVDDDNMLSVGWFFDRVPNDMEPFHQDRIPYWYGPIKDPQTGRWISTHVMNQDFIAWVGQGTIADRTQEHLGESDRGVIMMRRKLLEQAALVAQRGEPKGVIRDPELNRCIALPILGRERYVKGFPRTEIYQEVRGTPGPILPEGFVFQAGQPEEIRLAYQKAMGL
jgi:5,5'-dehydrodivanillate O-demethylase